MLDGSIDQQQSILTVSITLNGVFMLALLGLWLRYRRRS